MGVTSLLQATEAFALPTRVWLALVVVAMGVIVGLIVARVSRRFLVRLGVPGYIEGTSFERTARNLGTSTVSIITRLFFLFVVGVVVLAALSIVEITYADRFWNEVAGFLPELFVALLILIVGIVVGDKAELLVAEQLRGVKLPQTSVLPLIAKYTVFFLAVLVALSQVGVATFPLVVFLAAYLLAIIVFGAIAGRDLLVSATAGTYLLLNQPYVIGDEIRIGDTRGVVQEVGLFVTHVEDGEEIHVVPNRVVLETGVVRVRS